MSRLTKWEKIYVIIIICLAAGVRLSNTDEGDVVVFNQFDLFGLVTQIFEYGLLAFFCYLHRRTILQHLRHLRGPLPLALLAVVSTAWSIVPSWSLRRGIALVVITVLGYYMGAMLDPAALCRLYVRAIGLMVVLSVLVIVLLPKYGISHGVHAGDWRGAFYHKNRAGEMMALAFITFAVATPADVSRLARWAVAAVALALLYKSHAGTAVAAVIIVVAAQAVWRCLMMRRKVIIGVTLAGYPLVALAFGLIIKYSNSLFKLLGKDATFSGRDRLWAGVLDAIRLRPILGYGYLTFWLEQGGRTILVREKTTFVTIHAHNGFLNLMLHLGIVGLVLFLVFLVSTMWVTITEGRRTNSVQTRWFFSFMVLILVANLTESQILESPLIWQTLIAFYTSFSIQRAHRFDEAEAVIEMDQVHYLLA